MIRVNHRWNRLAADPRVKHFSVKPAVLRSTWSADIWAPIATPRLGNYVAKLELENGDEWTAERATEREAKRQILYRMERYGK